jgi:hypothetical protein
MRFGLVVGFIGLLQLVASKVYAVTVLHTKQMTAGQNTVSQSVRVFISRCLVAVFNGGHSPFSAFLNCPDLSYELLRTAANND